MNRRRTGPALLELIYQQKSGRIRQPGWWKAGTPVAHTAPAPADATNMLEKPPDRDAAIAPVAPVGPILSLSGDRMVVSLSSVSAGVAVFGLIVLLGVAFLTGRKVGEKSGLRLGYQEGVASIRAGAADEIEAAREAAPNAGIFSGVGTSPLRVGVASDSHSPSAEPAPTTAQSSSTPSPSPWVRDHTYIVVQEFKTEDRSDATAAQLFLRDYGVETAILESNGRYRYRLVTLKGFNRGDPVQQKLCDEYHARVKKLGKLFVKAGGRYDLQGYQKRLTRPGW